MRLQDLAREWLASNEPAVLIEVRDAQGSVPREDGTRMLVSAARAVGTIGGGHLEWKAIAQAREQLMRADDVPSSVSVRYALGPSLGQCCGGALTLHFERLTRDHLARWPAEAPLFHLQLYGAGHVGRAIVAVLSTLHVRVDWIDEREEEFPPVLPSQVRAVAVDGVEGEVRHAPPGACFLVLTHRHDLDLRITEAILRRNDFAFFGLIGSRTKRHSFIHRLRERGVADEAIDRMTCPIGVPGITGKQPEVIAVAVVAQLLRAAESR